MRGKNIALRREAVEILDRQKREGESYSDVVLRLVGRRRTLVELADFLESLPPVEGDDLDRRLAAIRRQGRKASIRRADL